jgi:O-antigen ligase
VPRRTSPAPIFVAVGGHVVLGVLMHQYPMLATAHALIVIAAAIGVAALTPWSDNIAYAAAYVVGAELLWRITDAQVFHEVGKYALILILGIGLLRLGGGRKVAMPVLYLAVLVPSVILTIDAYGLSRALEEVSFNLSGPAALGVAVLFFSRFRADPSTVRRLLWALVTPVVAIAAVAAYGTLRAGRIVFTESSNFVTSAGFGPNQVSAMLGLGALLALVLVVRDPVPTRRVLALVLAVWMLVQSVLTFSRGGLVNVVVAVVLAAAYSLRQPRRMAGFVAPVLVGMLVSGLFVYPRLVAYTGGVLETRFTDFTLEERSSLLEADLTAFRSNPVFGVGPGVGKQYRHLADGRGISAHTEFTRLLAEHGCAGVVAIGLLLAMVVASYRRAATRGNRMWVLLMAGWAVSEMTHGAMRFAAISFVFGLMTVTLVDDQAGVSA